MRFLVCPVPYFDVRANCRFVNDPVAVDAVKSITRSRVNHYNNEQGFPSIKFVGTDVQWCFGTLASREAMFEMLSSGEERVEPGALASAALDWLNRGLEAPLSANGGSMRRYDEIPVAPRERKTLW